MWSDLSVQSLFDILHRLASRTAANFFQMKCAVHLTAQTKDYYVENNFQH